MWEALLNEGLYVNLPAPGNPRGDDAASLLALRGAFERAVGEILAMFAARPCHLDASADIRANAAPSPDSRTGLD